MKKWIVVLGAVCLALTVSAFAPEAMAQEDAVAQIDSGDTAWMLCATALVLLPVALLMVRELLGDE